MILNREKNLAKSSSIQFTSVLQNDQLVPKTKKKDLRKFKKMLKFTGLYQSWIIQNSQEINYNFTLKRHVTAVTLHVGWSRRGVFDQA